MLWYVILYYILFCYIMSYVIILYYIILYYILFYTIYICHKTSEMLRRPRKNDPKTMGNMFFFCFVFSPRSSQRGGKHSHCSPVIHGESPKEMEVSCFTNNRSMEVLCIIGAFSHGYVSLLEFKMGILWSILRQTRRLPVTDLAYPLTNPFVGSLFLMSIAANLKQ